VYVCVEGCIGIAFSGDNDAVVSLTETGLNQLSKHLQ
jgi:hypothetical protein